MNGEREEQKKKQKRQGQQKTHKIIRISINVKVITKM